LNLAEGLVENNGTNAQLAMRFLIVSIFCLCGLACNRSNPTKQEVHKGDSSAVDVARTDSADGSILLRPKTSQRGRIFELGQLADMRLLGIHDTIYTEYREVDGQRLRGTGKFIPLLRSFRKAGYQIEADTKDSVWVIVEELNALRKGEGADKSEGNLFLVRKGIVVAADTEDVGVEQDSSMSYEVHRRVYTPAIGSSKSLLVIGEVSYPSHPDRTSFKAFGINKVEALVEFPGLYIEDPNELPGTLYDGQILTSGRNFGCIFYDQQIRFDLKSCSFIMPPEDSGYEARSDVQKAVFEANGDTIHVSVHRRPTVGSEEENIVLTKADSVYVTRLLNRDNRFWVLLSKNGKVLGWIDNTGIATLQLNACD
jgi:hypothetical protein